LRSAKLLLLWSNPIPDEGGQQHGPEIA